MEIPPAALFGALASVVAAAIATVATLYSTRTSKDLALAKLQIESRQADEQASIAREQANLAREQASGASFKDIVVHLTAEVDKKQARIDGLEARIDGLEEKLRQKEAEAMARSVRCLRIGEPCSGLPLTLPVVKPSSPPPPPGNDPGAPGSPSEKPH